MKRFLAIALSLAFICAAARAQSISGTWQGGDDRARFVLKIRKAQGTYRGDFYNLGDKLGDEDSGAPRNDKQYPDKNACRSCGQVLSEQYWGYFRGQAGGRRQKHDRHLDEDLQACTAVGADTRDQRNSLGDRHFAA